MEKLRDEKPDDLAITSIGALYRGQWDKKYWSSSRGKDRYPYPVGYQAIRTHSGSTYRMEICEGLKGPVFVVTSPDGDSCTGQTPDIAWENFQKKSCPKVKNWLGKRFSSKIDGVELFGFRNPFVQRLLRELVANVSGVAERSSAAPILYNRASKLDHESIEGSHAYPDLLPLLEKQQNTGKRSTKNRSSSENLTKEARIKRTRSQVLLHNSKCSSSYQEGQICSFSKDKSTVCFQEEHMSSSKDGARIQVTSSHLSNPPGNDIAIVNNEAVDPVCQNDGNNSSLKTGDMSVEPGYLLQEKMADVVEENCHSLLAVDEVRIDSKHSVCFFKKSILINEQRSQVGHENHHTCIGKILLESFDAELEQRDYLTSLRNNDGEHEGSVRHPDLCVPDTCETEKDSVVGSPLEGYKASLCCTKNELSVARPVPKTSIYCASRFPLRSLPEELASKSDQETSKSMHPQQEEVQVMCTPVDTLPIGIIKDSLPEVGSSSGSSNPTSEKIDLELAGQELARSMMTFLLPRAVPLLTKTYVKRRSRHRNRENKNDPCSTSSAPTSAEQDVENKHPTDKMCQGTSEANMLVQGPEVNIQEKLNAPQALTGADSLRQVTRVEPLLAGCMTTEPFTEGGSSKVIKSVIPDSFEDDQCGHDVAIKSKHTPILDEVDIAFIDGIRGNVNPPILPENSPERPYLFSGNDGCDRKILLPDGNKKDTTDAEVLCHRFMPRQGLSTTEKAEHSDHGPPCPHNQMGDEVPTTDIVSHIICSAESYSPTSQVNFDVHGAIDFKDSNVKSQVDAPRTSHGGHAPRTSHGGHDNRAGSVVNGESSLTCKPSVLSSVENHYGSHKIGRITHSSISSKNYIAPLSEINICRSYKNSNSPGMHFPQKIPDIDENNQARYAGSDADIRISVTDKVKTGEELHQLITMENVPASTIALISADVSRNQDMLKNANEDLKTSHLIDPSVSSFMDGVNSVSDAHAPGEGCTQCEERTNALGPLPCSDVEPPRQKTTDLDSKGHSHIQDTQKDCSFSKRESTLDMRDSMELVGCYLHPNPVLSISLASKEDSLHICVLCGLVDSDIRNLFMYMIPIQGYRGNSPSFLAYTSLILPLLKDACYRDIPIERSGLHFIPERKSLVFPNTIKAPRCREQSFDCSCTNCTSDYTEENTVEIVHVNFGYVSSVIKLVTMDRVCSILACEPNYLIAVEQSGKLHVWVMNLEWSAYLEEFMLPNFDEVSPVILELKRIPNCSCLIIGHNGLGGFGIWDISQRVLLAKFSSPGIVTFQILPVGLLKWQGKDSLPTCMGMNHVKETTPLIDNWYPKAEESSLSLLKEEIAVWLLVSADSAKDAQHQVQEPNRIPVGCWRLGLLVRNVVVLGSILDPRASAACTSSHYGMHGTCDGFLYKWELSSGEKLADLHPFKCGSVAHIAVDAKSGALAVAGNGCELLIYAQPRLSCK